MSGSDGKALVLLSGGQDSTTCLYWAIDRFGRDSVSTVSFDYGQRHRIELECAEAIAKHAGVAWRCLPIDTFTALGGVWVTPASVPDTHANPGNLDFAVTDLRWGGIWTSRRGLSIGVVNDVYIVEERVVSTSILAPLRDPDSGLAGASGNGRYGLELYRVGLTLEKRWGDDRPPRREAGIQTIEHADEDGRDLESRYEILD